MIVVLVAGWAVVSITGVLAITWLCRWPGGQVVSILQPLLPFAVATSAMVGAVALAFARWSLALAAGLIVAGGVGAAIALQRTRGAGVVAPHPAATRIGAFNLLYTNPIASAAADAIADLDLDLIVLSEYTAEHASAFAVHPLAVKYEHKIEQPAPGANGIAVWSRFPILLRSRPDTGRPTLDITVCPGDRAPWRLIAVHPATPVYDYREWLDDLHTLDRLLHDDPSATVMTGDFNATYWTPAFRSMLRDGVVSAQHSVGRWASSTYPSDRWYPPFVRLDHALVGPAVGLVEADDVDLPGSDHLGVVVTVVTPAAGSTAASGT